MWYIRLSLCGMDLSGYHQYAFSTVTKYITKRDINMIKFIKKLYNSYLDKKKKKELEKLYKERLEELKKRDPFIYKH